MGMNQDGWELYATSDVIMKYEYNKYVVICCLVVSFFVLVLFGVDAGYLAMRISWAIWGLSGAIEFFYKKKNISAILSLLMLILASYSLLGDYL